ncbi:MAG: hypothetical protein GF311_12785 [Candidatus Lokiarchaeota archaeon]|nr:hypothetical protein [Candidatus Lokiarchaeota archaeon]
MRFFWCSHYTCRIFGICGKCWFIFITLINTETFGYWIQEIPAKDKRQFEDLNGDDIHDYREYWKGNSTETSMEITDRLIQFYKQHYSGNFRITYNKLYIAAGIDERNFMWINLRKSNYVRFKIMIDNDSLKKALEIYEKMGKSPDRRYQSTSLQTDSLEIPLTQSDLEEYEAIYFYFFQNHIFTPILSLRT